MKNFVNLFLHVVDHFGHEDNEFALAFPLFIQMTFVQNTTGQHTSENLWLWISTKEMAVASNRSLIKWLIFFNNGNKVSNQISLELNVVMVISFLTLWRILRFQGRCHGFRISTVGSYRQFNLFSKYSITFSIQFGIILAFHILLWDQTS